MDEQVGEERVEVGFQEGQVSPKRRGGRLKVYRPIEATSESPRHPGEGQRNAVDRSVGGQPVLLGHDPHNRSDTRRHHIGTIKQAPVTALDEM